MLAGIRRAGLFTLALLAPVALADIQAKNFKAAVQSPDGLSDATYNLKPGSQWPDITLAAGASLRISATILDGSEPIVPAQSFIQLKDKDGEVATLAVGVKDNGKAGMLIHSDKLPKAVRALASPVEATLLLSSPGTKPLKWDLGSLTLPISSQDVPRKRHDLPPRAGEPAFAPLPEITHTFRPDEKVIGTTKALVGVVALILPWGFLFALIGKISNQLNFVTPPTMMYAFFGCLVALEGLILRYWIGWRLYQLLPPFLALSGATAYIGTVALRAARAQRLKAGGTP